MVCHRMCDYHHYSPEEEERLTTMVTTTGEMAQGEGCHDTATRMTAMVTTMQDRLQESSLDKKTTTSSDYIIRLTDRLRMLRSKLCGFFSQFLLFLGVPPGIVAHPFLRAHQHLLDPEPCDSQQLHLLTLHHSNIQL